MSESPSEAPDTGLRTADAAASLLSLRQPAEAAADAIDQAFSRAGASLTSALAKAATDGKASLSGLAGVVVGAVEAFTGSGSTGSASGSLAGALGAALSTAFTGARADGGPVSPGGAYLVGERGPEVFRPRTGGDVGSPASGGGTVVNVTLQGGGGAAALMRSEAQIASALARAVALGGAVVSLAFEEVLLPVRLAFGSTGGVERRTDIVTLASGFERRSTPWANGRRRWLIGGAIRKLEDAAALVAFFEARRGRLTGFRFTDFTDSASTPPGAAITPLDQALGLGDGARTSFAVVKAYGDGASAYVRPIAKPVAGSVRIAVAGAETTAFTADTTTGLVTLHAAPAAGAAVTAGFRFDVPVRFDADRIDVTLEGFDAGRVTAVPLIEVRV